MYVAGITFGYLKVAMLKDAHTLGQKVPDALQITMIYSKFMWLYGRRVPKSRGCNFELLF